MLRKETWKNWEKNILEIFSMALRELIAQGPLHEKENKLNRRLSIVARECNRKWCKTNNVVLPGFLFPEGKGQPGPRDAVKQPREDKIPDFTWGLVDHLNDEDKFFHIECKRLREKKYDYCIRYVKDGIRRFVEKEWSYGFGCESGLMIGYIQGMTFSDILHWVNHYTEKHSFPVLVLKGQWNKNDVSRLENVLNRPDVPISPFKLVHLWVDLR